MAEQEDKQRPQILYSCYAARSRTGEQFVPEHAFSYQLAGTLIVSDGTQEYTIGAGDFRLIRRNHLVKFTKQPPEGGEFQSLSIYLDQETLRRFSLDYDYEAGKSPDSRTVIPLKASTLYKSYMDSLLPYQPLTLPGNENLIALKLREAILILLQSDPKLANTLFDFAEPGKVDLEAFMHKNFHFNVALKRFAYMTGRSLATFKRDFERIFHSSPSRWLLHRRLQEAYYLIKEKGKAPSEVYLELGFEDLSHFSFVFKKTYGVAPSKV